MSAVQEPEDVPRVAVIGSINVDYVAYVERSPLTGETVHAADAFVGPGGKGSNQAFILGRLGADVAMFGAVGTDANGDLALESLRAAGVDVAHVIRVDVPTGIAMIAVDASGDNSIIITGGANRAVTPAYVDSVLEELARFDVVVMQLEVPLATVEHAARVLAAHGTTIVLDPAPAAALDGELLRAVDILKPNATELAHLAGLPVEGLDVEAAARALAARGATCVVASLGGDGALVVRADAPAVAIPAAPVDVVDTTGAGDSLTAAIAYAVAAGRPLEAAVRFGVAVASAVVQKRGAHAAVPSPGELHELWGAASDAVGSPA